MEHPYIWNDQTLPWISPIGLNIDFLATTILTHLATAGASHSVFNNGTVLFINVCIYYFFIAQGISDTEGEEKNWLENVNAGMTISPGGLPPQNCCGAR